MDHRHISVIKTVLESSQAVSDDPSVRLAVLWRVDRKATWVQSVSGCSGAPQGSHCLYHPSAVVSVLSYLVLCQVCPTYCSVVFLYVLVLMCERDPETNDLSETILEVCVAVSPPVCQSLWCLFDWKNAYLITSIYLPQEHISPGISTAMLPPADTFTWALPRCPCQLSSP